MVRLPFFLLILFRILESVPTSAGLEVWKFGILATPFDSSVPLKSVDGQVLSFPLSSKTPSDVVESVAVCESAASSLVSCPVQMYWYQVAERFCWSKGVRTNIYFTNRVQEQKVS